MEISCKICNTKAVKLAQFDDKWIGIEILAIFLRIIYINEIYILWFLGLDQDQEKGGEEVEAVTEGIVIIWILFLHVL